MKISQHAQERIQQRGFQQGFIDLVLEYGTAFEKNGSITEYRIQKKQKDLIICEMKKIIKKIENWSQKAVRLDDNSNTLVTVCDMTN